MVEPVTTLATTAGMAYISRDLVLKVLGPTAEYWGDGLQGYTEKAWENIKRIFEHADRTGRDGAGGVSPKVLKTILQEGAFTEDELACEYFGGVLASAKSEIARDDRGASFSSLVGRLTTYQVRSHFIMYSTVKALFDGSEIDPGPPENREALAVHISLADYDKAMDFGPKESLDDVIGHVMFGLEQEGLLFDDLEFGQPGITFRLSFVGIELFMWAHGFGHVHPRQFLYKEVELKAATPVTLPSGATKVHQ